MENLVDDDFDDDDDDDMDITWIWEGIREIMDASVTKSLGYYEMNQHKTWLDEQCSKLLYHKKQANLQWLQNPGQTNGDNMKSVRCETSGTFRN
jgi:hypothetical protein